MKPDVKCSRCGFVVYGKDKLYDERKKRHTMRHTRKKVVNERYPDTQAKEINGGLGGLDYGEVKWVTIW